MRLVCLFLILSGCANIETAREVPRKQVNDIVVQGNNQKDPTMRKRVVILPFLDVSEIRDPAIHENARRAFINDLNRTGQIIAIDSNDVKINAATLVTKSGDYDLKEASKMATQLGVNSVLEGKILDFKVKRSSDKVGLIRNVVTKFESIIRVRMVNARGGNELMNVVKTVVLDEPNTRVGERVEADQFIEGNPEMVKSIVKDAFMDFTPQVVSALDKVVWEGRIAAINGDRVYLNVGKVSGLQIGDILRVTEEGQDVYDPDSGSHLGKASGRMKGTLEVVSYFGTDGAVAVIHSGSGFKDNDKVELYQ